MYTGKIIGKGSFATVYRGKDYTINNNNQEVAIKVFDKRQHSDRGKRKMIQTEVDIILKLNHPNLVKTYRIIEDKNHLNIVMEYLGE